MYFITSREFLEMSQKASSVLANLPQKRLVFQGALPSFVHEGVEYPVKSVCIPDDADSDTLRFEFVQEGDSPYESLTIDPKTYALGIETRRREPEYKKDAFQEIESVLFILNTLLAQWVSSRPDSIETIGAKLAELLHKDGRKGTVFSFDWKSYDCEDDIPAINPYGTDIREKVEKVTINKEGTQITVCTVAEHCDGPYQHAYSFNLAYRSKKTGYCFENDALAFDERHRKIGIPDLLRDIYYELEDSWKIGNFETDFLGIEPTTNESSTTIE